MLLRALDLPEKFRETSDEYWNLHWLLLVPHVMEAAVVVSTARTAIGRAYKGALHSAHGPTMAGHAITEALRRSGLGNDMVEDVVLGCAYPEGATGSNVGRQAALRAGLPTAVPGTTVDRKCASGLQAIAMSAHRIMVGEAGVVVAGGVESVSLVQGSHTNRHMGKDPWLEANVPSLYWPMIQTADLVASRYGIPRLEQDRYAELSQQRTARAQSSGIFSDEIAPFLVAHPTEGDQPERTALFERDEGNRPNTTLESLSALKPIREGGFVTAGNASQLSDGASVCVMTSMSIARERSLPILGVFRGYSVIGCAPEEMGIGPAIAVPPLLQRHGLGVQDIGIWEMNEAFAVQVIYCRDRLKIDECRLNVNGGAISIGHPFGMTGSRLVGHALLEARRRSQRWAVVTMCIGGGLGAAALFEVPDA